MKGLRLFLRPIEAGDSATIGEFLKRHSPESAIPAWGVLAKLLGDIVAIASVEVSDGALRITDLVVATELRRKWIGRQVIAELERLARKLDVAELVAEPDAAAAGFFLRTGFTAAGTKMIRRV